MMNFFDLKIQQQINNLRKLWIHIPTNRRVSFYLLLILMTFASLSEIISIGSIFPFLAYITSPQKIYESGFMQFILSFFGLKNSDNLLSLFTIIFIISILFSGFLRLLLLKFQTQLSFSMGSDFSCLMYRKTLYQPYKFHTSKNTSELISSISSKSDSLIFYLIFPTLVILSSLLMLLGIILVLFFINFEITFFSFFTISLLYLVVVQLAKSKLTYHSKVVGEHLNRSLQALQEGLGGIRDVIIDGNQELYSRIYADSDRLLRNSRGSIQVISGLPKFILESLGMALLVFLAYSMIGNSNTQAQVIPLIGALALGAQRLLPILQQIFANWALITGGYFSVKDALELLDQPLPYYLDNDILGRKSSFAFRFSIELKNVYFHYPNNKKYILKNISLKIPKGSCVGFYGPTGEGKSTLMDILMGLLTPTSGKVLIDGIALKSSNTRSWQKLISHVPQNIFLADTTIAENIAFGVLKEKIDLHHLHYVSEKSQLLETILSWRQGFNTKVGERGVRISGGQKQRVAIARALYKSPSVIFLDEATSSLDTLTESKVMESIYNSNKNVTTIIVAHRLITLKKCSMIFEIQNSKVVKKGAYKNL
jgi:ABC-type multidrug transport system fused ATPase/permease subunit